MTEKIDKFLSKLESNFNVTYPVLNNATYKSLVNYASDLKDPIQRWYRYKEGYSIKLMDKLFKEYNIVKDDLILDPFCGSGSTLLQAKIKNIKSIGIEINPFSAFLAKVKTQNYTKNDLIYFNKNLKLVLNVNKQIKKLQKPKLSIIDKLFDKDVLDFLLKTRSFIESLDNKKIKSLYMLAWFSILEEASHHRKAGNGLKIRKGIKNTPRNLINAKEIFERKLSEIRDDLPYAIEISDKAYEPIIYEESALTINDKISPNSLKAVIFSPPYANCFDYTEIYKVELWMGGFVNEYKDLNILRKKGIRSHLNGYLSGEDKTDSGLMELDNLVSLLRKQELWDKRIPNMVSLYFKEMFSVLDNVYRSLKKQGVCVIIVSNSAYAGMVIPTDLLFSLYARNIGFKINKIEVARFIITSSQQYKETEKDKKYLRESIIHLQKI